MLRFAALPFLFVAFKAQETRPNHFLRGMPSTLKDQFPVRRLEGSAPAAGLAPAAAINVSLPVPSKGDLHLRGYNMFTRKVTVAWETTEPGLTWEVQVQRWNRYGDEILASWIGVGSLPETKMSSSKKKEMQMCEVFVDLQRYLYAFRVRAISSDGTWGAFSSATDLYGEPVDKNVSVPIGTSALQTSKINVEFGEPDAPEVLKLGNDVPLKHRGEQTFVVLKTVKVSLEIDVQPSFTSFYIWALEALPILRRSISKHLNTSASVSIKSCELFIHSPSCAAECTMRKYAALNVAATVVSEGSGAEYESKVDRVRVALQSLLGAKLQQTLVSELRNHDVLVPDGLALIQSSEVSTEEIELSVDVKESTMASEQSHTELTGERFLVGGGVIVLISGLVISLCFLIRKYRRLSQVARELTEKKKVITDLEDQASEIRHEMEEIQNAREAIRHEKEQTMCPAITTQKVEHVTQHVDPLAVWAVNEDNVQVLPTLLVKSISLHLKDGQKMNLSTNIGNTLV